MVNTCNYCYKQFGRKDNLQRHLHHTHAEEMSDTYSNSSQVSDDEYYTDAASDVSQSDTETVDLSSDDDAMSDSSSDSDAQSSNSRKTPTRQFDIWKYFIDLTYEAMEQDLVALVTKYRKEDRRGTLDDLRDEAFSHLKSEYVKQLRLVYTDFMTKMNTLQRNPVHMKIMQTAKRLRDDEDFSKDESVQYAAKKRKYLLETTMDGYTLPEIEDDESSSGDDDSDSMDEEEGSSI